MLLPGRLCSPLISVQVSAHLPVHRYIASLLAAIMRHPDSPPEFAEAWQQWAAGPVAVADAVDPADDSKQPVTLATLAVRPLQIQAWHAQVRHSAAMCPCAVTEMPGSTDAGPSKARARELDHQGVGHSTFE